MVSVFSPALEMTANEHRRVTEVTYLGYVWGTLAALRRMRTRDHGTIIQVSSALAFRSIPLQSAYCAAKHAIKGSPRQSDASSFMNVSRVHVGMVHLPAINTPQFDWVRSRLPHEPQPVPPIFQPEVAARAIAWASRNHRRDLWVGWPVAKAILGNRVMPAWLDRYLGRRLYRAQQTLAPARPHADNLRSPAPIDHEAHGRFDRRARAPSGYLWFTTHRAMLAGVFLLVILAGVLQPG